MVDMGDGTCSLLAGVLGPANRAFVLDSIMKAQHFDLDTRGEAFEKFLAEQLKIAVEKCRYKQIVRISEAGIKLKASARIEEMDLLFAVGRDLYVIECKCVMFPVEVIDEYLFVTRIKQAEAQLSRKIEFVRSCARKLSLLHPSLKNFPEPTRIRGLIVTTFQGGSAPFSSFPITTPEFLVDYLTNGRSMGEFEAGKKGVVVNDAHVVEHYNNFETFRENFWKCQVVQPHILTFRKMLFRFQNNIEFDQLGLKPIVAEESEVLIPEDEEGRQRALSAAASELRRHLAN